VLPQHALAAPLTAVMYFAALMQKQSINEERKEGGGGRRKKLIPILHKLKVTYGNLVQEGFHGWDVSLNKFVHLKHEWLFLSKLIIEC
jgi:hypothetical protein